MNALRQCDKPDSGFALLTCLILALLISLVSAYAMRTAILETRLVFVVMERERLFYAAERGIAQALLYATDNALPSEGGSTYPPLLEVGDEFSKEVSILTLQSDTQCPGMSGTRTHYEITSAAESATGSRRRHLQGFYICRESCFTADCTAIETGPVRSYWSMGAPDS